METKARARRKPAAPPDSSSTDRVTAYAQAVVAGEIVAGPSVRAACARHLRDLEDGHERGLTLDLAKVDNALAFFEEVLRLNGGEHEGEPFELQPWQAFIIGSLFGWIDVDTGYRRFRTAYIEIGKGNGKSPLAAGIGLYMLTADGEARAEVYAAASKKDQAMVLFRDAVAMVDQSPDLHARLLQTGGMRPWNLTYLPLHSFFRAISSDEGQSGPRPHCSLVDELHEHKNGIVVDMLKAGHKGRRQPLMVEITNSGFDRKTVCYKHHEYSIQICTGVKHDDEWFGYVCDLDKGDDPLKDESCWPKVNPNLGVSIDYKYLRGQVRQALGMPSQMSLVKRLNFCMWVDAANPWIGGEVWLKCERDFEEESIDLAELDEIVGALDLSGSLDLTSLALGGLRTVNVPVLDDEGKPIEIGEGKFELTERKQMLAMVEFWTPRDTLRERDQRDGTNYSLWVEQGYMTAPPGRNIDYGWVAFRLGELQALYPKFRRLAFDTYRIKYLEKELDELNIELELVPHPQGYYKAVEQSQEEVERLLRAGQKPKVALWMPRSVELLENVASEGRLLVARNPCLTSCSASAVTEADPKNNRIFTKRKSTGRIDGIVSLAMCTGFAFQAPPQLPPARIGFV